MGSNKLYNHDVAEIFTALAIAYELTLSDMDDATIEYLSLISKSLAANKPQVY